jgi:RHS repeat-associated protein
VKKSDTQGNLWTYTVGDGGLITSRTPQGNSGTQTTYNPDGSIATTVDEAGVTTGYSYHANGQVSQVTRDATGTPVTFVYQYDPTFPEKVTSIAASSTDWQSWRYEYHPQGSAAPGSLKAVKRVRTDGTTLDTLTTYTYDVKGRILNQTSSSGASTDYQYDARGNLQQVTGPSNNDGGTRPSTTYAYDSLDRVNSVTDPNSKATSYTYDLLGRIQTVTLPKPSPGSALNFTTTYSYDNFDSGTGLVYTHITDPNGRTTKLGYDEHGRLIRSVDASNQATVYAYTRSLLTSITDANGNVTSYQYDNLKRLAKTVFPDQREETYTYWPDGLLKYKTDRKSQTVTYTYDAHKRLVTKSYSTGGSIAYTYQGQKLTQVLDTTVTPNETHSFGYDDAYRVTNNTQGPRGALTYVYGSDDRVATMQIANGPSTTYGYHTDGSLKTITWSPVPGTFTYVYNPNGQYSEITFPNGQKRTYTYDDQGRLTNLANTFNSNPLATFAYGYDVDQQTGQATMLGQRVTVTETLPHQGLVNALMKFGYDPQYQLNRAEYPAPTPFNGEIHSWTYDAIGNRLTNTVNASIQNYTYLKNGQNPLNGQKLASDGTSAYTYDFNGNTLTRTGYGFGYDAENRLTTISGNETASYTYDYQGRRTSKTVEGVTSTYLYDGLNLIAETAGGQTSYFLNGPGIDDVVAMNRAGQISYLVSDGLGSAVGTNDPTGTVTHSIVFDAWGNTKSELGTRMHPFTYTGREVGEAALLHYRARQYQPSIGKFGSEDPIRFYGGENFYSFVVNSPVMVVDPTGLYPQTPTPSPVDCPLYCESAVLKAIAQAYKRAVEENRGRTAKSASLQIETGFYVVPNPSGPAYAGAILVGDRNGRLNIKVPKGGATFHTHMSSSGLPSTTRNNLAGSSERGDTLVASTTKTDVYVISGEGLAVAPASTTDPASGKDSYFIVKGTHFEEWYKALLRQCDGILSGLPPK